MHVCAPVHRKETVSQEKKDVFFGLGKYEVIGNSHTSSSLSSSSRYQELGPIRNTYQNRDSAVGYQNFTDSIKAKN